jgi:hypothetical protein
MGNSETSGHIPTEKKGGQSGLPRLNPMCILQKKEASKLVAAAKRLAVEATRCSKRRRLVQKPADRLHSPDHILLGARVAVYWPDDKQFYNVSCQTPLRVHPHSHLFGTAVSQQAFSPLFPPFFPPFSSGKMDTPWKA